MVGVTAPSFAVFETPIGPCAIAWTERAVVAFQLPDGTAEKTCVRLRRRWPGAVETSPPGWVTEIIGKVVRLLNGEKVDLTDVPLDLEASPDFHRQVYGVARTIPAGQTMTYGEIAKRLGVPHESREVGQAMGRNPVAVIVPCHRVLGADGKMGGFSANGGVATKRRILEIEGASAVGAGPLFAGLQRRNG
jgi:methylated-DNA-[protein]-cysteine S-methyltransferase